MKRQKRPQNDFPPELPEGRPLPHEANPGGTEGADSGWRGGQSEPILGPEPDFDTTYSTADAADAPKVEVVRFFHCDRCGQAFESQASLNVHRRTAHRPRA
jgi:hypothetical protein